MSSGKRLEDTKFLIDLSDGSSTRARHGAHACVRNIVYVSSGFCRSNLPHVLLLPVYFDCAFLCLRVCVLGSMRVSAQLSIVS